MGVKDTFGQSVQSSIKIGACISIGGVVQPNILVPLGMFTRPTCQIGNTSTQVIGKKSHWNVQK